MHATSLENMRRCFERHVASVAAPPSGRLAVLDVGGADVNGSYRELFADGRFDYRVADLAEGASVDIRLTDPTRLPLPDASIDIVVSGQMLEHCEYFWLTFAEMIRVLKPDGVLFLIAPSAGPIHRYPVDCYRFHPDAYAALAKLVQCELVDLWRDERGPWCDLVGVFRRRGWKAPPAVAATARAVPLPAGAPAVHDRYPATAPEEAIARSASYRDVLKRLHATLRPKLYLEIGVKDGRSAALASCRTIGVDPAPALPDPRPPMFELHETTSDRFFEEAARSALATPPDLVFIDGMHLFEFALRDFMNVERRAAATTLVVIDDVFPNHPVQAQRQRTTRVWTGDVWKLHDCLRRKRPDLLLLPIDCSPAGLLLVAGLDRANRVLWDHYNPIVREWSELEETPPPRVLRREGALAVDDPRLAGAVAALAAAAGAPTTAAEVVAAMRRALESRA